MPARKSNNKAKKNGKMSDGSKALKMVKRLKKGIELKHLDTQSTNIIDWNGLFITGFNTMAQGLTDVTRIGDSIVCKSFRLSICYSSFSTNSNVRIIIFWDKQDQIGAVTDILATSGSSQVTNSAYNYDKRHRFIILYDRLTVLQDPTVSISVKHTVKWLSLKHKLTTFNAGTTAILNNKLKMLLISDRDPAVPADRPQIEFFARMIYSDS